MNTTVQVDVPSGTKGFYRFSCRSIDPNTVVIETGSLAQPEGILDHYHDLRPGTDRGAQAVKSLLEECAKYKAFFEAMYKLSITALHSGTLEGFIEPGMADEGEQEEAYELAAQMIEERQRQDDIAAGTLGFHKD